MIDLQNLEILYAMTIFLKDFNLNLYNEDFKKGNTILEINLKKITKNYLFLSKFNKPGFTAAVVKADAYGCGINEVCPILSKSGCNFFFVAKFEEGLELRKYLPKSKTIAIFDGYLNPTNSLWKENNLVPVCNTVDQVLNASKDNILFMLHIDTGMNRLGLSCKEAKILFESSKLNFKKLILILSHFACSDNKNSKLNELQLNSFSSFNKYYPKITRSLSNSHGIFLKNKLKDEVSRPGIALYGYVNDDKINLDETINLYAPILQIRYPNIGETVGYDAIYKITKKTKLGVLGVGYADGLKRCINKRKKLKVGEFNIPILGRVSMDTIVVDLSLIPNKLLDEINHIPLIDDNYSIKNMAKDCSTIPYEIMTSFGKRLKRVYIK